MDNKRFVEAIASVTRDSGIGTLGEKTLHAVLKQYIEPEKKNREIKVGSAVADIFNENGIVEIQTRSFLRLKKKLPALLDTAPVTIIYPLPHLKWLTWIDPKTGETSERRKSPKVGRYYDGLYELSMIREFLSDDRLTVKIMLIDMEEYRNLDGWGNGGKRGSSRNERFPTALFDEYHLCCPEDYLIFLPDALPLEFTLKEYMKAAKVNHRQGQAGVYILRTLGFVEVCGKRGRENLYKTTKKHS